MAIKRYTPKYKILAKLKQALWLNKRSKIKKFKKQKWDGKARLYFPRKPKTYDQDSSTYITANDFDSDRATRLTKTYKYLLQDKQAFQLYYGGRRLKQYQLKRSAYFSKKVSQKKKISAGKMFFHSMENRLEVGLYRIGFFNSLMQVRKLLASQRIKVDNNLVKNFGFHMKCGNLVKIDRLKSIEILARYLKFNVPFFYFRKKELRKLFLFEKKEFVQNNILRRETVTYLDFLKTSLTHVTNFKKDVKKRI